MYGITGSCNTFNKLSKLQLLSPIIAASLFISIFYPGLMQPDSQAIYESAKLGIYSDHHPPMMAYLWHFFLNFKDGPALMYLTSMSMLWGSCMIMYLVIFKDKPWHVVCLLIPFIPQIIIYAGWIVKDNYFTFGYLMLSLWLAYKDLKQKKFNAFENLIFFIIVFYTTSVKYQAKFILPILLLWYVSVQFNKPSILSARSKLKVLIKHISIAMILCFSIINGIEITNNFLVTKHGQGSNNSWQYKKIYDLVGTSININQILVPKFLAKKEVMTLEDLTNHYELAWEPLIVYDHSPLRSAHSDKELAAIDKSWKQMIRNHPIGYLKHRLHIWATGILLSAPGEGYLTGKSTYLSSLEKKHGNLLGGLSFLANKFSWILYIFAYISIFPFQMYFIFSSLRLYSKENNKYAKAVFFMSIMGLTLLFLLFFFSLASMPRYIYFTYVMFFFSIPFFIAMRQQIRKERLVR